MVSRARVDLHQRIAHRRAVRRVRVGELRLQLDGEVGERAFARGEVEHVVLGLHAARRAAGARPDLTVDRLRAGAISVALRLREQPREAHAGVLGARALPDRAVERGGLRQLAEALELLGELQLIGGADSGISIAHQTGDCLGVATLLARVRHLEQHGIDPSTFLAARADGRGDRRDHAVEAQLRGGCAQGAQRARPCPGETFAQRLLGLGVALQVGQHQR